MGIRATTETKLLDAADALLFSRGVVATPIDAITERAGVSAATLYRGYPSKEALLAAALRRRERAWRETWEHAVARAASPRERLLAVFTALDEFRHRPGAARWCAFLGTAAELPDPPADVAAAIRDDTDGFRRRLTELAEPIAGDEAAELAEEILLVVTGELAMRLRSPGRDGMTARRVAEALIDRR
ncbi:TetR/AcrR family transcriptional regulator [Microbacterium sp. Marseille-Q6965]|uniref:TetR/AcrR family transcriptional regulator n=1 Tax=Microbacterium sp. Marseille-Q6965 TaxID=2965072 RepID=UPI0021B7B54E|nr:TetR/AcrR family transcriptional regulator [Microbacterium sp. Marseille-Q6965]